MLPLTTHLHTESGAVRVYSNGALVGTIHDSTYAIDDLLPAVITPAGEAHGLYPVHTQGEALTEIGIAARQYAYLPHPIGVRIIRSVTGEVAYDVSCPTCHEGGLPTVPMRALTRDAAPVAENDHHRISGQYAVVVDHPRALPRPGPPTNSPYFR